VDTPDVTFHRIRNNPVTNEVVGDDVNFFVQVWAQPPDMSLPRDGFEADAQRLLLRQAMQPGPLQFHTLAHSLIERFDAIDSDPLWLDDLRRVDLAAPVLDIAMDADSPRFEAALSMLISRAQELGLHVADNVSGVVHLSDGSVVGEAEDVVIMPSIDEISSWQASRSYSSRSDAVWRNSVRSVTEAALAESPADSPSRQVSSQAEALFQRGKALLRPQLGEPNPEQALRCLQRAATEGHPRAALELAMCYLHGVGTDRDTRQAREWLERGQADGSAEARYQLGRLLVAGWGGAAEPERGFQLYLDAAALGHADATFGLASCLDAGHGCSADPLAARALFLRARALGSNLKAHGLRVKQRELNQVRALASRFEMTSNLREVLRERRMERMRLESRAREATELRAETRRRGEKARPSPLGSGSFLTHNSVPRQVWAYAALAVASLSTPLVWAFTPPGHSAPRLVLCLLLAGVAAWGLWQVRPTGSGNGNSGRRMSF
jgi:TPR repeat protein